MSNYKRRYTIWQWKNDNKTFTPVLAAHFGETEDGALETARRFMELIKYPGDMIVLSYWEHDLDALQRVSETPGECYTAEEQYRSDIHHVLAIYRKNEAGEVERDDSMNGTVFYDRLGIPAWFQAYIAEEAPRAWWINAKGEKHACPVSDLFITGDFVKRAFDSILASKGELSSFASVGDREKAIIPREHMTSIFGLIKGSSGDMFATIKTTYYHHTCPSGGRVAWEAEKRIPHREYERIAEGYNRMIFHAAAHGWKGLKDALICL